MLALLREGLSNREIGERLEITERGARHHVSEILSKLSVASREEAAAWEPEGGAEEGRPWWARVIRSRKSGDSWFAIPASMAVMLTVGALVPGAFAFGIVGERSQAEEWPPTVKGYYGEGTITLSDGWTMRTPAAEVTCTLIGPNAHGEPWYDCPAPFDLDPYVKAHIEEAGLNDPPFDVAPGVSGAVTCWSLAPGEQSGQPVMGESSSGCQIVGWSHGR